jgi:hypothetical protein
MIRTYSSQVFFVRSGSVPNPPSSVHVDDRAHDVECRRALGDPHRMVHLGHAHDRAVPDPNALGPRGDRGQEDLR